MAEFKGIIQSLAKSHQDAFSLTCDINSLIYPNIERKSFVSAIIAKIDPAKELITFTRAGHTPVLFCSGYDMTSAIAQFNEEPLTRFLPKPFDMASFTMVLRQLLEEAAQTARPPV